MKIAPWLLATLFVGSFVPCTRAQGNGAGTVPDGGAVPGSSLALSKGSNGEISLSWGSSCLPTDTDYAVYTGVLGDFAGHGPRLCSTGGNTSASFVPTGGNRFFLVVPNNGQHEGGYGSRSGGVGRPRGRAVCFPQAVACGAAPPNSGPVGIADVWTTPTGQTVLIDVLANDSDPDDGPQPLFVDSVSVPRFGVANLEPDGQVSYMPFPGYAGPDDFEYTLSDGDQQTSTPVNITIGPSPPDPTCTFSASPNNLPDGGGTAALTWSSTGGVRATLNGGRVPTSGTLTVQAITSATYTLEVHGQPGTASIECHDMINVPDLGCLADEICPVECGTGLLQNFVTGDLIQLDPADMIHVLMLPDGYTAAEIDQFHTAPCPDWENDPDNCSDVESWFKEWEVIDIYAAYRDAFCFWKMPVLSSVNAVPGGAVEDTAFAIHIDSADKVNLSDDNDLAETSSRIWDVIDQFLYPPASFYPEEQDGVPGADRTDRAAKNLVVVTMIYRTSTGKQGYGGKAYFLENPDDPSQRVLSAMANNRPHEFTHALTRLWDEYIDIEDPDANPNCQPNDAAFHSRGLSNVVCNPVCAVLPWTHLLFGQGINPVEDLVEAWGVPEEGYHSELLCLMNGTRQSNQDIFGGNRSLRSADRMCNYCREVTTFRILERVHHLDDPGWSYGVWEWIYRQPFYDTFGFFVPAPVPQSSGMGVFPIADDYACDEIP